MIKMGFKRFRTSLDRIEINSDGNNASKLRNLSSRPIRTLRTKDRAPKMSFGWPLEARGTSGHLSGELDCENLGLRCPKYPVGPGY